MKTFSVLSWNVQGTQTGWYGTSFRRVAQVLQRTTADIVCLQELPDAEAKLPSVQNLAKYYSFIPKHNSLQDHLKHGYNHNVLLSKYPFLHVSEIVFPSSMSPQGVLESAICADIQIGTERLRLFLCHLAVVGAGIETRIKQLRYIMEEARRSSGPTIICGDMNAAMPQSRFGKFVVQLWHGWPRNEMRLENKRLRVAESVVHHTEIVRHGFRELVDVTKATWSPLRTAWFELFKLKLDWFCVKQLTALEVELGDYVSDHRHIEVVCSLDI